MHIQKKIKAREEKESLFAIVTLQLQVSDKSANFNQLVIENFLLMFCPLVTGAFY